MLIESVCRYPTVLFIAVFATIGLWQLPLLLQQIHSIFVGLTAYEKMNLRKKYVEKQRQCKQHEEHGSCVKMEWTNGLSVKQNINEFLFKRSVIIYNHKKQ